MKKCGRPSVQKLAKKKWCQCKALSKYRLSKLEPEERRMQRAFLKEHTHVDWRGYRPRFLKTVAGSGRTRPRREAAQSTTTEAAATSAEGSVLRDVAEDELEQVELIMEDISDEISDLEVNRQHIKTFFHLDILFIDVFILGLKALTETNNVSISTEAADILPVTVAPSTAGPNPQLNNNGDGKLNCQIVGQSRINCSSEVYSDPATWRLSRNFLEQQIRILRVQLDELKVIRKHLKAMRPMGGGKIQKTNNKQRTNSKSKSSTSSLFDWSSPPLSLNRTLTNASDVVYQPPPFTGNRRKQQPKAPEPVPIDSDGQVEEEDEDDDDEEEPTAEPVDIEVTIYDNRKVK